MDTLEDVVIPIGYILSSQLQMSGAVAYVSMILVAAGNGVLVGYWVTRGNTRPIRR